MRVNVYASFLLACAFGMVAPGVARRVRPALAAWLISVGALIASLCALGALALCAFTLAAGDGEVAEEGHWSAHVFDHVDPVRRSIAVIAALGVLLGLVRAGILVQRRVRAARALRRALRGVPAGGDLTVVAGDRVEAYVVPGGPGRIVVTRGMLRSLSREEMLAVIAHERSHLRHRHHLHRLMVALAAALHPMLIPLRDAQEWVTERWADEDAARCTAPGVVAAALRRVSHSPEPALVLFAAGASVERRIEALSKQPSRWHTGYAVLTVVVLLASVVALFDAVSDTATLLHVASRVTPVSLHHAKS